MHPGTDTDRPYPADAAQSENRTDQAPAVVPVLEPDADVGAHGAYDDGLLAEIPFALDAYIDRQCFGHC